MNAWCFSEAAVGADDASPGDLAYLVDRVRVANGEPQVYGTKVTTGPDGEIVPVRPRGRGERAPAVPRPG